MSNRTQRWIPDIERGRVVQWCKLEKRQYQKECWSAAHGRITYRDMCRKCEFYKG